MVDRRVRSIKELSKILCSKPGVGQNIALRASSAAWNSALLISILIAFYIQSTSFFPSPLSAFYLRHVGLTAVSRVHRE